MKKTILTLCMMFVLTCAIFAERSITDMAGREMAIPDADEIETVFAGNPTASVFLYTLDMDKMAGWNVTLYKDSKPLFPQKVQNLPHYGTLYGNGKPVSEEELLAAEPQLILLMGEITSTFKAKADEISDRFAIPVVLLDNELDKLSEAYTLLGSICGDEERGALLGEYCDRVLARAEQLSGEIPVSERKRVFYSLNTDGLKTYPRKTTLSEYMELCGAENVADVNYTKKMGHVSVTFEQLAEWDPEFILAGSFANSPAISGSVYNQPMWKALSAEVVLIPYVPFDAFAKPPSVNRIAGIIWLQSLLYPERADYDADEELAEFNSLFYSIGG